jgi:hypothetical protein
MGAEKSVDLLPMDGDTELNVVDTKNITGSCGGSIVTVFGVTDSSGYVFRIYYETAKIEITSYKDRDIPKVLGLNHKVLSDLNGIACIARTSGDKLLIWSRCGGTHCAPEFTFFVIDPKRLVFLSPKSGCDAKCAARLIGSDLPYKINGDP